MEGTGMGMEQRRISDFKVLRFVKTEKRVWPRVIFKKITEKSHHKIINASIFMDFFHDLECRLNLGFIQFFHSTPCWTQRGESWTDVTTEVLILAPKNQYSPCWSLGKRTKKEKVPKLFFWETTWRGLWKGIGIWIRYMYIYIYYIYIYSI